MQQSLAFRREFSQAHYITGERSSGLSHGVVMTRDHIVGMMLDLVGYVAELPLHQLPLLEPSCGHGAFVVEAARRLIRSSRNHGIDWSALTDSIRAVEVDAGSAAIARAAVLRVLQEEGIPESTAENLVDNWIAVDDFLLAPLPQTFAFAVGNPPYVRIEQIHRELQSEYRARYATLYDRADLYVAFIERCLHLLRKDGRISFICADRWITNKYGKRLRDLVTSRFATDAYVQIEEGSPFEEDVSAYPSIFVFRRGEPQPTRVYRISGHDSELASRLVADFVSQTRVSKIAEVHDVWFQGEAPWTLTGARLLNVLQQLEARHPLLEECGSTKVGIGIATGADKVFLVPMNLDVEPDRLVPLVMRKDIHRGEIDCARRAVINTYAPEGGVIDLRSYPKLAAYFYAHEKVIRQRHVSKQGPGWFRTIDKLHVELTARPKLLIPDIAGATEVVLDIGNYYPHHNLYHIISDDWDLEVLGGLLSSRVALFFIWSYATKMRGGYLRFQAQYLRRIRVPNPSNLDTKLKAQLAKAFRERDFSTLDRLALAAYEIDSLPDFDFVDTRS
jgi:adenine-specific DNA-methyltransferase